MLQGFNYKVIHVDGTDSKHQVADCLSRLHGPAVKASLSTCSCCYKDSGIDCGRSSDGSEYLLVPLVGSKVVYDYTGSVSYGRFVPRTRAARGVILHRWPRDPKQKFFDNLFMLP